MHFHTKFGQKWRSCWVAKFVDQTCHRRLYQGVVYQKGLEGHYESTSVCGMGHLVGQLLRKSYSILLDYHLGTLNTSILQISSKAKTYYVVGGGDH